MIGLVSESPRARSIVLDMPQWPGHRAGQHVDVRLTAPDGYQAQRSYSIASAPEDGQLQLTVERLPDGEVSPYLVDDLREGDALELRGPIGGYFIWQDSLGGPVMLVAGGSGIVPFRSMLRHHRSVRSQVPVRLLYSSRDVEDVLFREELTRIGTSDEIDVTLTLTRDHPAGWRGYGRRIDRAMLDEVGWAAAERPLIYLCGPTAFVETAADLLLASGHEADRIRIERFGGIGTNS